MIEPMLAGSDQGRLPDDPAFSYEFKWDGYRAIMRVAADGTTVLTSRNGKDFTLRYPALATAVGDCLGGLPAVLDGEIVALDRRGRPSFDHLKHRQSSGVSYFAFDLLLLGKTSLLRQPYSARRELLNTIEPPDRNLLAITPSYGHADLTGQGLTPKDLLDVAEQNGIEGLIAKVTDSTYQPGVRSTDWLKHPLFHTREVVLGGWRVGQGRRAGTIGALLLGAYDDGNLRYIGDVGTGFTDQTLRELQRRLVAYEQPKSPFVNPVERTRDVHWLRPELVGDVEYRNVTSDGVLRHSSWRGLREDRNPDEVVWPPN